MKRIFCLIFVLTIVVIVATAISGCNTTTAEWQTEPETELATEKITEPSTEPTIDRMTDPAPEVRSICYTEAYFRCDTTFNPELETEPETEPMVDSFDNAAETMPEPEGTYSFGFDDVESENFFFSTHIPFPIPELGGPRLIYETENYAIVLMEDNKTIRSYVYGFTFSEQKFTEEVRFVGYSPLVGFLFKSGTNLWTISPVVNSSEAEWLLKDPLLLSDEVAYVICTNYVYSSDGWSQPLVVTTTGAIRCYIGPNIMGFPDWTGLQYEGGMGDYYLGQAVPENPWW